MQDSYLNDFINKITVPLSFDKNSDKIIDSWLNGAREDDYYVVNISVLSLTNHTVKYPFAIHPNVIKALAKKTDNNIPTDVIFSSRSDADSFILDINNKSIDLKFIYNVLDTIYELEEFCSFDINDFIITYNSLRKDKYGYFNIQPGQRCGV